MPSAVLLAWREGSQRLDLHIGAAEQLRSSVPICVSLPDTSPCNFPINLNLTARHLLHLRRLPPPLRTVHVHWRALHRLCGTVQHNLEPNPGQTRGRDPRYHCERGLDHPAPWRYRALQARVELQEPQYRDQLVVGQERVCGLEDDL